MKRSTKQNGVTWVKTDGGYAPHYRFRGMHTLGPDRPYPRYLEGERMTVARYILCLVCETLFDEAPLNFRPVGHGFEYVGPNDDWDKLPYMVEDPNRKLGWKMNDGNPDVMGIFDN